MQSQGPQKAHMEAKASKHASKREHACARARVCMCVRVRVRPGGAHQRTTLVTRSRPEVVALRDLRAVERLDRADHAEYLRQLHLARHVRLARGRPEAGGGLTPARDVGVSPSCSNTCQMLVLVRCYHLDNSGVSTSGLTPG